VSERWASEPVSERASEYTNVSSSWHVLQMTTGGAGMGTVAGAVIGGAVGGLMFGPAGLVAGAAGGAALGGVTGGAMGGGASFTVFSVRVRATWSLAARASRSRPSLRRLETSHQMHDVQGAFQEARVASLAVPLPWMLDVVLRQGTHTARALSLSLSLSPYERAHIDILTLDLFRCRSWPCLCIC